jgi:hypothetical protein
MKASAVCLVLACLCVPAFGGGWVNIGNRFLKYYPTKLTWDQALKTCTDQGAVLAYDDHPTVKAQISKKGSTRNILYGV